MASDLFPTHDPFEINLDNYFPYRNGFNTVVYVHKKYLKDVQQPKKETSKKESSKKKRAVKNKNLTEDKAVSCDIKEKRGLHEEAIVNQTIRFAKNLAPQLIPPSENDSVVYTVKTCKHRKKEKRSPERKKDRKDYIIIPKKTMETYRREKNNRECCSGRESNSSQNTLDDLNINQSLSYTLSTPDKKEAKASNKRNKSANFAISESFEGLAEINDIGETRIKLQLMSEKEKYNLIDSLRNPLVNSVQDCLSKNNIEMRVEIKSIQRSLRNNSEKLDTVIDRLACIEKYLAYKVLNSPRPKSARVSRLEQLGEDLEEKRYSSEEELPKLDRQRQRHELEIVYENRLEKGCGEETGGKASVGVRTEKPNRLPARFCWTDTKTNN